MTLQFRGLITSGLACCLAVAGIAYGQQQKDKTTKRTESRTRTTTEIRRSSAIIGATVNLQAGTRYGKVEEFVISEDGCIEYVIVAYDDRYVPVPWAIATFNVGDRILILDIDGDRIDDIPTFTEYSQLSNTEFTTKVKTFHKVESRTRERSTKDAGKSSDRSEKKSGDGKAADEKSKSKSKDQPGTKKSDAEKKASGDKDNEKEKKSDDKKSDEEKSDKKPEPEKKSDKKPGGGQG